MFSFDINVKQGWEPLQPHFNCLSIVLIENHIFLWGIRLLIRNMLHSLQGDCKKALEKVEPLRQPLKRQAGFSLPWQEIKEQYPEEAAARKADKLCGSIRGPWDSNS